MRSKTILFIALLLCVLNVNAQNTDGDGVWRKTIILSTLDGTTMEYLIDKDTKIIVEKPLFIIETEGTVINLELDNMQRIEYGKKFVASEDETVTISIGSSGKTSYCGDKSLDFSFSDEVKAYIATGYDEGAGIIWLTRVKDVPAGTPVLIKGKADTPYEIPVTDSKNSYYKNMFKGNTSGESVKVGETEGDFMNYYLSGKDGTFKSVNKSVNIGNNKCYLQLPGKFAPAAKGEAQKVTIAAIGKSSFAAPVDLDFTNVEGLKAFAATGFDKSTGTIWLTRVMKVQKGEGLLLKGEANKEYTIPSVEVQGEYMNMFVGNISGDKISVGEKSEDGAWTNYYLSGKDGIFKSVNKSVNIGNNKSYLQLPTEMMAKTRGAESNVSLRKLVDVETIGEYIGFGYSNDETTDISDGITPPQAVREP